MAIPSSLRRRRRGAPAHRRAATTCRATHHTPLELLSTSAILHRRGVRKERQARALHSGTAEHGAARHIGQQLTRTLVGHVLEQRQCTPAGIHNAIRRHSGHMQRILNRGRSSRIARGIPYAADTCPYARTSSATNSTSSWANSSAWANARVRSSARSASAGLVAP